MEKEIQAALKAAQKYKSRNEGDRSEAELVINMLDDALRHAATLTELADAYDQRQRIARAHDELRAAQAQ